MPEPPKRVLAFLEPAPEVGLEEPAWAVNPELHNVRSIRAPGGHSSLINFFLVTGLELLFNFVNTYDWVHPDITPLSVFYEAHIFGYIWRFPKVRVPQIIQH